MLIHHHQGCMKLVFIYLLAMDLRSLKAIVQYCSRNVLGGLSQKISHGREPGLSGGHKQSHTLYLQPPFFSQQRKKSRFFSNQYFIGLSSSSSRVLDSSGFHALNWARAGYLTHLFDLGPPLLPTVKTQSIIFQSACCFLDDLILESGVQVSNQSTWIHLNESNHQPTEVMFLALGQITSSFGPSHASSIARSSCMHLRGNSSSLGTNVTILFELCPNVLTQRAQSTIPRHKDDII